MEAGGEEAATLLWRKMEEVFFVTSFTKLWRPALFTVPFPGCNAGNHFILHLF
jgi:hypothetical protein